MCEVSEWIYAQGFEKGRMEGIAESRIEEAKEIARRMYQRGLTASEIADLLNRSEAQIEEWQGLVMA